MPVYAGNKNLTLYWGAGDAQGMSNVRLYLGDKLVYIPFRPPEGDLLLAGSGTYLKGGADVYLDYKNTPQVQNELDGLHLGNEPFTFSFRVNGAYIGQGTRFLLDFPGLIRAKSDRNTLAFMTDVYKPGVWQYVDSSVLQSGWNSCLLEYQGDKLKLEINGTTYTLADKKTVATRRVSGFSAENYLKLKKPFTFSASYKMIFGVRTAGNVSETQPIIVHPSLDRCLYLQGSSSCLSYYYGSSKVGVTEMQPNTDYWAGLEFAGGEIRFYLAEDDGKYMSADEVPDFSDGSFWIYQNSATTEVFQGQNLNLGYNYASGKYWLGSMALEKMRITTDGTVFFDGKTAAEGTDFENTGCNITQGTAVTPDITAGILQVTAGKDELNRIQGILL